MDDHSETGLPGPELPAGGPEVVFESRAGGRDTPYRWRHLKLCARTEAALMADPAFSPDLAEALTDRDTLPRADQMEAHTLLILRGINHDPNASREDMVSIRLAITPTEIVSVEFRRLHQMDLMMQAFRRGNAPKSVSAFVRRLADALRQEAEPVLDALEDRIGRLESRMLSAAARDTPPGERLKLIEARRDVIQLQRFIAPQAGALELVARLKPGWLTDKRALREEATAFRRIASDLDALRMRAQLVAEEAARALGEATNRTVVLLSAVSVVFLPLTFLTGLLGVNLSGIPAAESPWAFGIFSILLVAVALLAIWIARRLLR